MQKRQEVLKRLAARSLRTNRPIAPTGRFRASSPSLLRAWWNSSCTVTGGVLSFSEIVMNIRRVNVCSSEPLCCLRGILARHHESNDLQVAEFCFAREPGCPAAGASCGHEFAARPAFRSGRISTAVIFHDAVYLLPVPLHG